MSNKVYSPKHYNIGSIEVIDAIDDWQLNFNLGNAIKYIARCNYKDNKIQDMQKAVWYISREIQKEAMKNENNGMQKKQTEEPREV